MQPIRLIGIMPHPFPLTSLPGNHLLPIKWFLLVAGLYLETIRENSLDEFTGNLFSGNIPRISSLLKKEVSKKSIQSYLNEIKDNYEDAKLISLVIQQIKELIEIL